MSNLYTPQRLDEFIQFLQEKKCGNHQCIKTGYENLDHFFDGFYHGKLYVVAARPGRGKTTFLLNLIYKLISFDIKVFVVSTELSKEDCIERLLAIESGIEYSKIRLVEEQSYGDVLSLVNSFGKFPLYIYDKAAPRVDEIISLSQDIEPQIIFIDYIQNLCSIPGLPDHYSISRNIESLEISAKNQKVPIILASQLHRRLGEVSDDYEPFMSDLKGSGKIEESASGIIFLWHEENRTVLKIAKNRLTGLLGRMSMICKPETGKME